MQKIVKPFGLGRNIFFIYENFKLMLKKFVEYKENLYASFLFFFVWYVSQLFFVLLIAKNFGDEIGWTFDDFIIFTIVVNLIWSFIGLFKWGNGLFFTLKKGNLNVLLTKPLSNKFKYYFSDIDEVGFFYFLSNICYVLFLLFYFDIDISYNLIAIFCLILNTLLFTFFWLAIDSFNFYSLGLIEIFRPIGTIEHSLQFYPANYFQNSKFRFLIMILPLYFAGTLLVPLFNGSFITTQLYVQMVLLFLLTIFSYLLLVFNWHYGLKKYEAFG